MRVLVSSLVKVVCLLQPMTDTDLHIMTEQGSVLPVTPAFPLATVLSVTIDSHSTLIAKCHFAFQRPL